MLISSKDIMNIFYVQAYFVCQITSEILRKYFI